MFPEIYLSFVICIALILVGTANFLPAANSIAQKKQVTFSLYQFAQFSFVLLLLFYFFQIFTLTTSHMVFNSYAISDLYTQVLKFVLVFTMLVILSASESYIIKHPRHLMEYPVLILLTTIFLLVLISSSNFITLFLAMIGFSLNIYVLLLYDSFNHSSCEAGIKYYYLSTFSSGLIISGIFLVYLIFHNTSFLSIAWILYNWSEVELLELKSVLYFMIYFLIFGFLFKLAAFPCHLWAPEVYEGSPHTITAILIVPIKIATFGLFLRVLYYPFANLFFIWDYILWISAFFSMIWGCLGALRESRIKRFLAYSSINQMGFLFMGLACGTFEGLRSSLIYLFLYIVMNLSFFLLFLNTKEEKTNRSLTYLSDFNDYAQDQYLYSVTVVIILFSMAGIPPLGGFFGKYFLFLHSYNMGHVELVLVGMITSVIATYYYLRIIKLMWFEKPVPFRYQFETVFTTPLFITYISLEFLLVWFVIWIPWILKWANLLTKTCLYPVTTIY